MIRIINENKQTVEELKDYIYSELKYIDTPLSAMKDTIYAAFDDGSITRDEEEYLLDWLEEVK